MDSKRSKSSVFVLTLLMLALTLPSFPALGNACDPSLSCTPYEQDPNAGGDWFAQCAPGNDYDTCITNCECRYGHDRTLCGSNVVCIEAAMAERNACYGRCTREY